MIPTDNRPANEASQPKIRNTGSPADGALIDPADLPTFGSLSRPPSRSSWTRGVVWVFLVLLDFASIACSLFLAFYLRQNLPIGDDNFNRNNPLLVPGRAPMEFGLTALALFGSFWQHNLYSLKRGHSRIDEFYRIISATFFGIIFAVALNSLVLAADFQYSRIILVYAFFAVIVIASLNRIIFGTMLDWLRARGMSRITILVIGTDDVARRVVQKVQAAPQLGYRVAGLIMTNADLPPPSPHDDPATRILGRLADIPRVVQEQAVDEIIVSTSGASQEFLLSIVEMCDDLNVTIRIYPDAFQLITTSDVTIGELIGLPLVSVRTVRLRGANRLIKRTMDIVLSAIILIILSPLLLAVAFLVKLTSRGSVFYSQERVGVDGRSFRILKFRTMRVGADKEGEGWTKRNDPRRTPIGGVLRRYSIDELPQFVNVLIGDMSVVGPRPEQPKFVDRFSQTIPRYMLRHREKAGITGWAQINGLRGDTSIEERTRYDLYYVENWSVLFDIKIILKSILFVLSDRGAS